ncbi:hypothetical protein J7438_07095 [Thalassotalea sp. G20_0]|uniref:DUF7217 family protein n=1 Tax=Thalassotalea sp. G20_0 TaxID=2821093 RepID=UPI001ADA9F6E|nr:hypothetical protein [Thalassotalea sp. G20_0]MBO9493851.1 hypothetical protein [Thalassotalea sp. G20_0]
MQFNIDVFKAVKAGASAVSPVPGIASTLAGDSGDVVTKLKALPIEGLSEHITTIEQCQGTFTNFSNHAQDQVDNAIQRSSIAQTAKQVESYVDQIPPSCLNTEAMMGSITGAVDSVMSAIGGVIGQMSSAITDFISGSMSESELVAMIGTLASELQASASVLADKIKAELEFIEEAFAALKNMSMVISIESMWNDPCGQAVMDKVLPDNIKEFL